MDQSGNNHLLLRATQSAPPAYPGQPSYTAQAGYNAQPGYTGQSAYSGQPAADRMRELLARTVHDHIVEERSVASALAEIRLRLDTMDETGGPGTTGTLDGLAASLGAQDSKLTARLERLDERLDDQYDRVRSIDGKLEGQAAGLEETVARAVEAATTDLTARIASLEDAVLALAEALLRPTAARIAPPPHSAINGRG